MYIFCKPHPNNHNDYVASLTINFALEAISLRPHEKSSVLLLRMQLYGSDDYFASAPNPLRCISNTL